MPAAIIEPPKTAATPPPAPTKDLRERLGIKKRAPKAPDVPPVIAAAAPPPVAPAPKKKPATTPAPAIQKIDEEKLGEAIGRSMKAAPPAPAVAPAPDLVKKPELSAVNKRRLMILEQMAKDDPAEKELPAKFLKAIEKEAEYRKEWETAHEGEKFDPNAPEHESFFTGNDVDWDADAFDMARETVNQAETLSKAEASIKPKFDAIEAEKRERESVPKILTHQATAAKLLFDKLGASFEKVLKPTGEIDHDEIKRLIEENPILSQVFPIAEHTERVAGQIYRIANGISGFDAKNPLHAEIAGFVTEQEAEMKKLPEDEQKNPAGKIFATAAEWSKMPQAEREKHWHFNEEHLTAIFAAQQAAKANKIITDEEEKFKKLSEKRGYQKVESANGTPARNGKPPEPPTSATPPPPSPAGVIAPRMAASKNAANNSEKSIFQRLRGVK